MKKIEAGIEGSLEKIKKVVVEKKRNPWEFEEPIFKDPTKRNHTKFIDDCGFEDEDEMQNYKYLIK
jgi:hypothetical protein